MKNPIHLLSLVERYLTESGTAASRFGRDALGDPGFVAALRRGRQPGTRTISKVAAYIQAARTTR